MPVLEDDKRDMILEELDRRGVDVDRFRRKDVPLRVQSDVLRDLSDIVSPPVQPSEATAVDPGLQFQQPVNLLDRVLPNRLPGDITKGERIFANDAGETLWRVFNNTFAGVTRLPFELAQMIGGIGGEVAKDITEPLKIKDPLDISPLPRTEKALRTVATEVLKFVPRQLNEVYKMFGGNLEINPDFNMDDVLFDLSPFGGAIALDSPLREIPPEKITEARQNFVANPVETLALALPLLRGGVRAGAGPVSRGIAGLNRKIQDNFVAYGGDLKTPLGKSAVNFVRRRHAELEKSYARSTLWRESAQRKITPADSEDLIFALQKTGNPLKGDVSKTQPFKRLTPAARKLLIPLRERFNEVRKAVNESGFSQELGFIQDYVTQFWKIKKKSPEFAQAVSFFGTHNPFTKGRLFESYERGIAAGFTPRYRNIFDVLEQYERINARIIQNNTLVKSVQDLNAGHMAGQPTIAASGFAAEVGGGVSLSSEVGQLRPTLKRALPRTSERNVSTDLGKYSDRIYRETSLKRAEELLPGGVGVDLSVKELHFANDPSLALGQKGNVGILLELDATGLSGKVNRAKPGYGFLADQGKAEFIARHNQQSAYRNAVRSVTIRPNAQTDKLTRVTTNRLLAGLERRGWRKSTLDDGSIKYTRPESAAPPIPAQSRADAYLTFSQSLTSSFPKRTGLIVAAPKTPPVDYVKITSKPLYRAAGGRGSGETVHVHPDIAQPIRTVFEEPFSGPMFHRAEILNAISKKLVLSASFFHHIALTESALYSGVLPPNFKKGLGLLKERRFRNDMINSGLEIVTPSDVHRGIIRQFLVNIEEGTRSIKGAHLGAKLLRNTNELWDKALWDYYHRGLKAYTYQEKLNWALQQHKSLTPLQTTEIKRAVARHVNNAFGGQNWESLMKSPRWRQVAHLAWLAPDWTLSNIKIASSAFKTGRGGLGASVEGKLARRYWLRAGLVFYGASNIANKSLSGHWMWENERGHEWDIDTGMKDENGRRIYTVASKQVREPMRWLLHPLKEAANKAAPVWQMLSEQFTGASLSGYPTELSRSRRDDMGILENLFIRGKMIGSHAVPFSFGENNILYAFPVRRGEDPKRGKGKIVRSVLDLMIDADKSAPNKAVLRYREAYDHLLYWNLQFPQNPIEPKDIGHQAKKSRELRQLKKKLGVE